MTSLIIMCLGICTSAFLPLLSQPLSLGLSIMVLALFLCMLISVFFSSWYGYVLFLIYVGGMLVMFAYVAALCPNTLFQGKLFNWNLIIILVLVNYLVYSYFFVDFSIVGSLEELSKYSAISVYGLELVSFEMISVLVGLGCILLINLVVVVKICYYQYGPLRPFLEKE